jgi:hypothetical protein
VIDMHVLIGEEFHEHAFEKLFKDDIDTDDGDGKVTQAEMCKFIFDIMNKPSKLPNT